MKYYLEEDDDWSLSIEELEKSYKEAVDQGVMIVFRGGESIARPYK